MSLLPSHNGPGEVYYRMKNPSGRCGMSETCGTGFAALMGAAGNVR